MGRKMPLAMSGSRLFPTTSQALNAAANMLPAMAPFTNEQDYKIIDTNKYPMYALKRYILTKEEGIACVRYDLIAT